MENTFNFQVLQFPTHRSSRVCEREKERPVILFHYHLMLYVTWFFCNLCSFAILAQSCISRIQVCVKMLNVKWLYGTEQVRAVLLLQVCFHTHDALSLLESSYCSA